MAHRDPAVSVIIPARNAAATLATPLAALAAQTVSAWEAIVVDDASSDGTAELALRLAAGDARVRVVQGEGRGPGVARNAGLAAARHEWLLFLDADDSLAPEALHSLTAALEHHPDADAVVGGWMYVAPDGRQFGQAFPLLEPSAFSALARHCPFTIHSLIVRRDVVRAVGGFDATLQTCEDWDLWQRIARAGARFVTVPRVVAHYHARAGSATRRAVRLLPDGLRVIATGHGADPRVAHPSAGYAAGRARADEPRSRYGLIAWAAAIALGCGADTAAALEAIRECPPHDAPAEPLAYCLAHTLPFAAGVTPAEYDALWARVGERAVELVDAVERATATRGLARRTWLLVARQLFDAAPPLPRRPCAIGSTLGISLEVTAPIADVALPAGVVDIHATVLLEGERLGTVELPVEHGRVSAAALRSAIAGAYAWPILGRFFERTIYPSLVRDALSEGHVRVLRGSVPLGEVPGDSSAAALHDALGWTVFLQEVWGRPEWTRERFYDAAPAPGAPPRSDSAAIIECEISAPLEPLLATGSTLCVAARAGGAPLGAVPIPAREGRVSVGTLVSAITHATGLELCRVAVCQALLGQPLDAGNGTLRERLAAAATGEGSGPGVLTHRTTVSWRPE